MPFLHHSYQTGGTSPCPTIKYPNISIASGRKKWAAERKQHYVKSEENLCLEKKLYATEGKDPQIILRILLTHLSGIKALWNKVPSWFCSD